MTVLEKLVKKSVACMSILRSRNINYLKIKNIPEEEMKEARIRYLLGNKVLNYILMSIDKQSNTIELLKI